MKPKATGSPGQVSSSQKSVHPGLQRIVARHMSRAWRQPVHRATLDAWKRLKIEAGFSNTCAFILDSGCGTGTSSRYLANRHPQMRVLGVDQSASRLSKNGVRDGLLVEGNLILLRAELSSLWRLMLQEGYQPAFHYLLYPNPWPKPGHLKRRWHAHPVFPVMLALGGELEMRCNWDIYAREFALAVSQVCGQKVEALGYKAETAVTLFEEKYKQRGHSLYTVKIPAAACTAYASFSASSSVSGAAGSGV